MKKLLLAFAFLGLSVHVFSQQEDFSNCSAAFLGDKMIVNEYTTEGKSVLPSTATGMLTLRPVTLFTDKPPIPGEKIRFKVAIRGNGNRAIMLFSEKTYKEIDIQKIMKACKKGDHIVLLTLEREWAVPHSEILVE